MKNGKQIQIKLNEGRLYRAVKDAADQIRDSGEYDRLDQPSREFAVLCYAIEQNQTYGADVLATVDDIFNGVLLNEHYSADLTNKSDDDNRLSALEDSVEKLLRGLREVENGPSSY